MITNNNIDLQNNINGESNATCIVNEDNAANGIFDNGSTAPNIGRLHTESKANININSSYFTRFDKRIGGNLTAVINGTRFRSSSCSKSTKAHTNTALTNSNTYMNAMRRHQEPATPRAAQHRRQHSPTFSLHLQNISPQLNGTTGRQCPTLHLLPHGNLNCNAIEKVNQPLSSDEDNSPTELNNSKRLADKPPLIKRLAMGLLRSSEESCPLMNSATNKLTYAVCNEVYSNGYINEEGYEPEKYIASKFGDSCRQSLTTIPMVENTKNFNDNNEFNLKKRYLRETSSANSSPKIFANRLCLNNAQYRSGSGVKGSLNNANPSDPVTLSDHEAELKDASWFQAGISREIATEVLSSKSPGAFLVRKSSSKPGCYALTLRVPSPPGPLIANYIITRTARGYKIKGFSKEFTTLKALVTHHSVMAELLPIALSVPRPTSLLSSRRNLDDFDTYDSLQMLLKYLRAKDMEND